MTPATLNVTGASVTAKTYDSTTLATITGGTLTGLLSTETLALTQEGSFADKNVGTGKAVTAAFKIADGTNGGLANNYSLTQPTGLTGTITARPLTVTYTGVDKVYDGLATATVTTADNRLAGDSLSITRSASFADVASVANTGKNAGSTKAISVSGVSLGGTDAGNYSVLLQPALPQPPSLKRP